MTRLLTLTVTQAILVAGLIGCAHTPSGVDEFSFPERQSYLQQLDGWSLRGRLAVNTGEQAFQGSFQWEQTLDALDLSIRGPLGTGVLQVTGPAHNLTVRARGETWDLTDPESELSALLGWWLPVRSFSAWLLGFPDPNFAADTTIGPDDALQTLEQRRWNLNYESYRVADGVLLPRRIDLVYQDLELRVIIDRWQSISNN